MGRRFCIGRRNGFGRAVSRILSAPCGGENHLSMQPYPESVRLRGSWSGPPRGFPIWPCTRWGFPCRVACASRGALLPHLFTITAGLRRRLSVFCGTFRRNVFQRSSRVYPGRTGPGYVASCPAVFGLSSPGLRQERSSALPKPLIAYFNKDGFSRDIGHYLRKHPTVLADGHHAQRPTPNVYKGALALFHQRLYSHIAADHRSALRGRRNTPSGCPALRLIKNPPREISRSGVKG